MQPNQQPTNENGFVPDPKILKVVQTLRQIESGGDYSAVGDGGDAHGAFQYNERTGPGWKNIARQYLGDENAPMDRANQNKATYMRIADWKNQGFNLEEIPALWNGATKTPEGRYTCVNQEYCNKFRETLMGMQQPTPPLYQQQQSGTAPLSQPVTTNQPPTLEETKEKLSTKRNLEYKEEGGKDFGTRLGKGVLDFVAPILTDKERTGGQWVGDAALTALNVVPGSLLAKAGIKGAVNFLRGAKKLSKTEEAAKAAAGVAKGRLSLGTIGKGATVGYGMDVGTSLSEGETEFRDVLEPGIGTILGGIGGALLRKAPKAEVEKAARDLIPDMSYGKSVAQTGKTGLEKSGILGTIQQPLTADVYKTTEAVLKNVPDFNKYGTYTEKLNAVNTARTKLADDLAKQVVANGDDIIYPFRELESKMKALEMPIQVRADTTQRNQYNIAREAALKIAKAKGGKISDLFEARKEFDRLVDQQFPTLYDRQNAPMLQAITDMRKVMNETIEGALKKRGVDYSDSLLQQTLLFDARDALAAKAYKELGTNKVQRFMINHPLVQQTVDAGVKGVIPAGVGVGAASLLFKD